MSNGVQSANTFAGLWSAPIFMVAWKGMKDKKKRADGREIIQ
jgi:hypothetical protein